MAGAGSPSKCTAIVHPSIAAAEDSASVCGRKKVKISDARQISIVFRGLLGWIVEQVHGDRAPQHRSCLRERLGLRVEGLRLRALRGLR